MLEYFFIRVSKSRAVRKASKKQSRALRKMRYIGNTPKAPKLGRIRGRKGLITNPN